MSVQTGVGFASTHLAGRRRGGRSATLGAIAAAAMLLAGCQPATTRLATRDPADPAAPVRGVGYGSTIAPYISLRPATPTSWRDRNEQVTPPPRNRRESQ